MNLARIRQAIRARTTYRQWFLAYRFCDPEAVPPPALLRLAPGVQRIVPPLDRHWADPFPVERDGRYYIFCEEYVYREARAGIAVFEVSGDRPPRGPTTVLKPEYHVSYPFVFRWKGTDFLMPETAAAGRLEVYRARRFPEDWELESSSPLESPLTDPTPVEVEGRWWMFANLRTEPEGLWDRDLHLFHGPSPLGPWESHPRNPVKSDLANARPAGRLFWHGGELFRPAQDSSRGYGYAVVINRVERLTPLDYEERPVARLEPDWARGLVGTHTMNWSGRLFTIDGVVRRSRLKPVPRLTGTRAPPGGSA
ncbi:MAG: hypothetical protein ACE5HQ_13780 [Gemmatimonadota bacterium]